MDSSAAPCEASPMALTNALRTRASRYDVHGTGPTCALLVSDRYPATTPRVPRCSVVVPSADAASRGHMARPSPVLLGEQAGIKRSVPLAGNAKAGERLIRPSETLAATICRISVIRRGDRGETAGGRPTHQAGRGTGRRPSSWASRRPAVSCSSRTELAATWRSTWRLVRRRRGSAFQRSRFARLRETRARRGSRLSRRSSRVRATSRSARASEAPVRRSSLPGGSTRAGQAAASLQRVGLRSCDSAAPGGLDGARSVYARGPSPVPLAKVDDGLHGGVCVRCLPA